MDFDRSKSLNTIPNKKLLDILFSIENSEKDLKIKSIKLTAINRYAESNIPIEYWFLKMERDFKGDPRLLAKYNEYISEIKSSYNDGLSICLAGNVGRGKTLSACCILKKACEKGYSCLYTNISDIVNVMLNAHSDEKFLAKRELSMVDFLFIDELDNRYYSQSDHSNDMFAKTFESIFRSRLSNNLPTLIATNSPNIKETFLSSFKESVGSLMNKIEIFVVLGDDFRAVK